MNKKLNKKRNVGIMYGLLTSYMTKHLIERKNKKAQEVYGVIKKYFSPRAVLSEELQIFNVIENAKVKNVETAKTILEQALKYAGKINHSKNNNFKSKLILEVNKTFNDPGFYKQRIKNYKFFSSLQQLLDHSRGKKDVLVEVSKKAQLKEVVLEHMIKEKKEDKTITINEDYNGLTFKIMVEKFNNKYNNVLNKRQKFIMKHYINSLLDESVDLKNIVLKETTLIGQVLSNSSYDKVIYGDKETLERFNETRKRFGEFKQLIVSTPAINDNQIVDLLKYQELCEELMDTGHE